MVTCLPVLILPDVFSGALGWERDAAFPSCGDGALIRAPSAPNVLLAHAAVTFVCLAVLGALGAPVSFLILQNRKEVIGMKVSLGLFRGAALSWRRCGVSG